MQLFDLTGQTALVTGSSMGIGYALAKGLAQAGAHIVLNARDGDRLQKAADALRKTGATVDTLVFDVTDAAAVRAAIDGYEATRAISILINNAGMQHRGPLEDFEVDAFDRLMRTNVNSAFYVGQAVGRHMISRNAGRIINIASVQTALARPGIAPYTASKGAIANLTKGILIRHLTRHLLLIRRSRNGWKNEPQLGVGAKLKSLSARRSFCRRPHPAL